MGIVKAISGHTGARRIMRYLERDGRARARDFLHIGAPIEGWEGDLPRYGACDWAAEWIGDTYLDDSGRDSPAFLNSTGDM